MAAATRAETFLGWRALPALVAARTGLRRAGTPALVGLGLALLALLPYLLALAGAPGGAYFRGSLRPSTDEGLYLTAVRLGAQGDWLWHDPFAVQSPPPILIYPTYFLAGHAGAVLGLTPRATFILYHPLAVLLLAGALWWPARRYLGPRDRPWFMAFALGTSSLYWLDALLAAAGHAPVSLTRMGMQQASGFSLGLIVGHEGVGLAGQVLAFTAVLAALEARGAAGRRAALLAGGAGTLLVGLAFPVLLPLSLAVGAGYACWWGWRRGGPGRGAALADALLRVLPVLLPGLPFALYYYYLFSHGVWRVFQQIGGLDPLEGVLTWGLLLPLAWWGWRRAPAAARPLADILVLWCGVAVCGTALNHWQGSRLSNGLNLAIGMLFALGLLGGEHDRRRRLRLLFAVGLGLICQYLFLLTSLAQGNAAHLYNTAAREQALRWLAGHTGPRDVVLAPFMFGNVVPEISRAHVVAGEYDQTYDFATRYPQLLSFFGPDSTTGRRLAVLGETRATLVVYDAAETQEGPFDPRGLPGLRTVFAVPGVAIMRVEPAP